ncbi:hypothetical protein ACFLRO_01220 [Bacteroidota bacterium]
MKHRDVIENPFGTALRVSEFLQYDTMPELMAQAVDPQLYREKIEATGIEGAAGDNA